MWSIGYSHQHGWSIGPRHLSCSGIHSSLISGESQGCPPVRVHSTASRMTCDQEKSARHLERSVHSMMSTSAPKALVWPHQHTRTQKLRRIPRCMSDSSHSILRKNCWVVSTELRLDRQVGGTSATGLPGWAQWIQCSFNLHHVHVTNVQTYMPTRYVGWVHWR